MKETSRLKVNIIEDAAAFESLGQVWDELLDKSYAKVVCLTHSWLVSWWNSFGGANKLHVITVTDSSNNLIAVAPMMLTSYSFRGIKLRKVCFMVNGHSPYADFIVHEKSIPQCLEAIISYLVSFKTWDIIGLDKLNEGGQSYLFLKNYLRKSQQPFGTNTGLEIPYIEIAGDWETFYRERSPKYKKGIRNKINRINKAGDITIEEIPIHEEWEKIVSDMCQISANSWKKSENKDILSLPGSKNFFNELSQRFGSKGLASAWFLKLDGEPIAFEFHLKWNKVIYPLRADYDENFKSLSPGSVLEYNILNNIFTEQSFREYDSCGHTYDYLMRLTDTTRKLVKLEIFNKNTFSYILYATEYKIIPVLRKLKGIMFNK